RSHRRDDGRSRDAHAGRLGPGAMIQITPQMRILVGVEAVDFRKGIDGLARTCREVLAADPFSGWLFVFRNRRQTALRILVYDGQGFWLAHNQPSSHCTSFNVS